MILGTKANAGSLCLVLQVIAVMRDDIILKSPPSLGLRMQILDFIMN